MVGDVDGYVEFGCDDVVCVDLVFVYDECVDVVVLCVDI